MNFIELAKKRYSVRSYQDTTVENEKLNAILEAGRIAPTAANKQPNHFLVLDNSESIEKLNKATNGHGAPLAIVVCGDNNTAWVRPFDSHSMLDIDATVATDHMMLCAESLGLNSCWLTYFDPKILCSELNIPKNLLPINILVIGYSADKMSQSPERHSTTRKPFNSIVHYNSF